MPKYTRRKVHKMRKEIQFLRMKKGKLHLHLYYTHVKTASERDKLWYHTESEINAIMSKEIGKKWKTTDVRIKKLNKSNHKDEAFILG